ncbi:EscU/YscU/HrcU family type III secretion system export apparatus switch protein [Tolumonas lignilytica]|uniref:EscU/YscU/HrcU family type III secretion system export apparatus switch protein n=1 Tax=Tolumonas lignilytica TaxID=1283284 RepID=UPI00046311F5|nr:EscU/YscU/HrcU family type III secretion system export apparatus switch protein [Tolumonas lignilytica]
MNKPKDIIGLTYDGQTTPSVSHKASGSVAEQILKLAEKQGLYIHQDPELLERLSVLQDGDPIPPALFVIIAEILAYSYVLQGKTPEHWRRPDGSTGINVRS